MSAFTDFLENRVNDSMWRGGALAAGGGLNSAAICKGVWTATTAYALGDIVIPHGNMTGAGGKFLQCTTAGTSASTNTLAVPAVGSTLSDGSVVWRAISGMPTPDVLYLALLVANKGARANSTAYSVGDVIHLTANGGTNGDNKPHLYRCTTAGTTAASQSGYLGVPGEAITDGTATFTECSPVLDAGTGWPSGLTEVSSSSTGYGRLAVTMSMANMAGTQAAASTTASTGSSGTTSNNNALTYGAPTAPWAASGPQVAGWMWYDIGGNPYSWGVLTTPKTVNTGDPAPSFAAAALQQQVDN